MSKIELTTASEELRKEISNRLPMNTEVETAINDKASLLAADIEVAKKGIEPFDTKANMDAFTPGVDDPKIAKVMNDTADNNGQYRWNGTSWVKRADFYASVLNPDDTTEAINGKAVGDFFLEKEGNLIDKSTAVDGAYIDRTSGDEIALGPVSYVEVPLSGDQIYYFTPKITPWINVSHYCSFFDSAGNRLGHQDLYEEKVSTPITPPNGTVVAKINYATGNLDEIFVSKTMMEVEAIGKLSDTFVDVFAKDFTKNFFNTEVFKSFKGFFGQAGTYQKSETFFTVAPIPVNSGDSLLVENWAEETGSLSPENISTAGWWLDANRKLISRVTGPSDPVTYIAPEGAEYGIFLFVAGKESALSVKKVVPNTILVDDATNPKIEAIACSIRNQNGVWSFIDDASHKPIGFGTVETLVGGQVKINYAKEYSQVVSFLAVPDETYAKKGITMGSSVGKAHSLIDLYKNNPSFFIRWNGTSWVVSGDNYNLVDATSYDNETGVLTINHKDLGNDGTFDLQLTGREGAFIPVVHSFDSDITQVSFRKTDGSIYTGLPNTDMRVFVKRGGSVRVDESSASISGSNIWITGYMIL